jgi:prepilin peptidase CpaA
MLPGYGLGATGAGDVKLMAAVGAIVGPPLVFSAFVCTCLAGGVLAIVVAVRRRRLGATLTQTGRLVAAPGAAPGEIKAATAASRFAYGPAIAIGSLVAVLIS